MPDPTDTSRSPAQPTTATMSGRTSSMGDDRTEIERDAESARRAAGQAAEDARRAAADLGAEAKHAAGKAADDMKAEARSFAEEQKEAVAGRVDGMADALRSAAGSLDDQSQSAMAGYAREAASSLEGVSDALSKKSLDDLVDTVEDFARRQPVAFLGGAVLAGFVMSRFAKSSAERRYQERYDRHASAQAAVAASRPLQAGGHGVNPPTAAGDAGMSGHVSAREIG